MMHMSSILLIFAIYLLSILDHLDRKRVQLIDTS